MKPIIFSTPMVRAILEGRKTQTRRVIKPQPPSFVDYFEKRGDYFKAYMVPGEPCDYPLIKPPYQPNDILWVKETWQYRRYGDYGYTPNDFMYRADPNEVWVGPWRSPRYMPRKAARIFLKVKDVRVERLQGITEEDARAEGFVAKIRHAKTYEDNIFNGSTTAREEFAMYWDGINAKRGCGWETNPWVWVIEFEKIQESEVDNNG